MEAEEVVVEELVRGLMVKADELRLLLEGGEGSSPTARAESRRMMEEGGTEADEVEAGRPEMETAAVSWDESESDVGWEGSGGGRGVGEGRARMAR